MKRSLGVRGRKMGGWAVVLAVMGLALLPASVAQASFIKFTTNAMGLGSADLNDGGVVDPDIAGKFVTSPTTGQGSILSIQQSGLAGSGTILDPLFVTVTAKTHLDTLTGLPSPNDYQAGVIYITKENNGLPDGRDEGLGVRAFTVNGPTGLRTFSGGLAKIEGSKEVSGGTGPAAYDSGDSNGAPHVDEAVWFEFASPYVVAHDTAVLVSEFETTDRIDLHLETLSGTFDVAFTGPADTSLFESLGDSVYKVKFSGVPGLSTTDILQRFSIRALDDDPAHPRGTAEHFLISGMETTVAPEPATLALLGAGVAAALAARRNRRR